jgi:hypothetical protein
MTIWRMFIAGWIPKTTATHSEYVTLISFPCNGSCTNASHRYVTCVCVPSSVFCALFVCKCVLYYCHRLPTQRQLNNNNNNNNLIRTMAGLFIHIWLSACYTSYTPVSHYANPHWSLGYLCDIYGCQRDIGKGYLS